MIKIATIKMINDSYNKFENIMTYALKYTLLRNNNVVYDVVNFIMENENHINKRIQKIMIDDINKARNDSVIHNYYNKEFDRLFDWLNNIKYKI